MENIKLETDIKLEKIFISLESRHKDKLDSLLDTQEIDVSEKSMIRKYKYLLDKVDGKLSVETLKEEFPSLWFNDLAPLSKEQINDYISIYISVKKQQSVSRKLMDVSSKIREEGLNENTIDELNTIIKSDVSETPFFDVSNHILEKYKEAKVVDGIKTGVKRIDSEIGGILPGTLTTLMGFTGSFKTTWAVNIAYNSIFSNLNTLYLSLEVSKEDIMYNLLSRHSNDSRFKSQIEHFALKHNSLSEDAYEFLEKEVYPDYLEKTKKSKIYIVGEDDLSSYSFYSLEKLFMKIEKLAIEETGHGIDILVVDHVQLLKMSGNLNGVGKETSILNLYVSFFRQCCLNWVKTGRKIAVLLLSQTSRQGYAEAKKNNGKYQETALAEANELERASSILVSSYSDDALAQVNSVKVQLIKNRNRGKVDPIEVYSNPKYYYFGDIKGVSTSNTFNNIDIGQLLNTDNSELSGIFNSTQNEQNIIDIGI